MAHSAQLSTSGGTIKTTIKPLGHSSPAAHKQPAVPMSNTVVPQLHAVAQSARASTVQPSRLLRKTIKVLSPSGTQLQCNARCSHVHSHLQATTFVSSVMRCLRPTHKGRHIVLQTQTNQHLCQTNLCCCCFSSCAALCSMCLLLPLAPRCQC